MPQRPGTDAPYARTLPQLATQLIGREADVMEVCKRFEQGVRLVTLTGPGGIGKTRLALAVVERIGDVVEDDVEFVLLAAIADYRLVVPTIARTLGVLEQADRPILARLIDYLRERQTLLLLDNFEHVIPAADAVAELLRECPRLSILATSREPLHLSSEREYAVAPLPLPAAGLQEPLDSLAGNDAVRLFVERATAVSSGFVLTDANAPVVSAICHRVGGLPLAIELAASRIKVLSPDDLLARLDASTGPGPLRLLTGGPRDAPSRHQTMRDTIQWSCDLLTPDEQRAFRQLSVFAGGWTVEAAEAVVDLDNTIETLASLIDKSLVQWIDIPDQPARYSMLEPIRQFALESLTEPDENVSVRRRQVDYFLGLVEHLSDDVDGPDARRWHERIDAEHDNLRGVLRWLRESGEVERGLLLVGRLFKFWNVRGYGIEGLAHADAFLSLPGASRRTFGRATALNAASWLAHGHGDLIRSVPLSEEACAIFEEHGDHAHLAWALLGRGIGHAQQGDDEQARVDWERALLLFQEVGNNAYIARVLVLLGQFEYHRGDLDRSRALAEEALELARVGEHLLVMAFALGALGVLAEQSGDDSWAVALYRERLDISHLLGLPSHIADAIEQFAGIAFRHGQLERAVRLFGASSVIRDRTGRRRSQPFATRTDDAIRALRDSLADATLHAAWAEGRELSLDAAIEYALSDEGDALPEPANDAASILTRRELDVLRLIVDGKSNQEIAGDLFISPNTVTTHVANIMNKLGLDSRTAVATWAVRNGIV